MSTASTAAKLWRNYGAGSGSVEREQVLQLRRRASPFRLAPVPRQESMANNFGLLLYPVVHQSPARRQPIAVAAERVATERQIPPSAPLRLPDMRHLVQEQRLQIERAGSKIIAIKRARSSEMEMPARRHRDMARLQRPPAPAVDPHPRTIHRTAEHACDQRGFPGGQPPRSAGRAGRRRAQCWCSELIASAPLSIPGMSPSPGRAIEGTSEPLPVASVRASRL